MKKFDGIKKLSDMSGLTMETIREIAEQVMENNKKLNSCSFHEFDKHTQKRKWICRNCGGTVDTIRKEWYCNGIRHSLNLTWVDVKESLPIEGYVCYIDDGVSVTREVYTGEFKDTVHGPIISWTVVPGTLK